MGQYFKIVNPAKKQFLDAGRFNENEKSSGIFYGYHAIALAYLVCNMDQVRDGWGKSIYNFGEVAGSWCGDSVFVVGDDHGKADEFGVKTATEGNPDRNLYWMAKEEFEDISYKALAMLCNCREDVAEGIARSAANSPRPESELVVTNQIRFDDGIAYERYMGKWSQLAGETFLDWLNPKSNLRWLDVGCGNGAFTEMLVERCAPVSVQGIDPSEAQLAYARSRAAARVAQFRQGDAMAMPFADNTFDAAVMPLVIFFVPDPAKGVAEMARVVCPGGIVTAYAWDMDGGGFPYQLLHNEMRALGVEVPVPPNPDASRIDALRDLWTGAGLNAVETREITVHRTFADFDDYWTTIFGGPSVGPKLAAMAPNDLALLKARMRAHLPSDSSGRVTYSARANAAKGRVPN